LHSNLEALKREMLDALRDGDFAVFHGSTHGGEGGSAVYWDAERQPDYHAFLAAAGTLGVKLVIFSEREFRAGEIDQSLDELEDCELTHEERRSLERRLRDLRVFEGRTCALRLTFHYEAREYIFDLRTDWFDDFLELRDEIAARLPEEDDEEDESLGGLYSNN
jgi:hypothetical protein